MDVLEALGVSDAGRQKLRQFEALVEKWTQKINLISRATVDQIWERHILDSARLCLVEQLDVRRWVDLGSGGGFPGLVVAVILQDRKLPCEMVLVESDARKSTFLREAARQIGVTVVVQTARVESLAPQAASVVSARALTALDGLCGFAERHLAPGGVCLFPKGERADEEIAAARKNWRFDLEAVENPDHKGASLLVLRNLHRA